MWKGCNTSGLEKDQHDAGAPTSLEKVQRNSMATIEKHSCSPHRVDTVCYETTITIALESSVHGAYMKVHVVMGIKKKSSFCQVENVTIMPTLFSMPSLPAVSSFSLYFPHHCLGSGSAHVSRFVYGVGDI
jgi:hypothetical protein